MDNELPDSDVEDSIAIYKAAFCTFHFHDANLFMKNVQNVQYVRNIIKILKFRILTCLFPIIM